MGIPFVFSRLRTVIMTSLALLILSAMLLTHVVTAKLTEKDLIEARLESGRLLLKAVPMIVSDQQLERTPDQRRGFSSVIQKRLLSLFQGSAFTGILIKNNRGSVVFSHGEWQSKDAAQKDIRPRLSSSLRVDFRGKTWGLFWPAPENVVMTAPLQIGGGFKGSISILSKLDSLYEKVRDSEPVILAYIAMNALILVLFGIYLLSRTVVRPIKRLVTMTEGFDGDIPIMEKGDHPDNEIGQLSKSLNRMLRKLDANKRALKENISSLEAANQEIKRAQDEIIESEKMASVGRLATGVAHEIGNPLGIMLGYVELLQQGGLTAFEQEDFLRRMESELTRVHRIIRDLLDFSRPSIVRKGYSDAHKVLEEVLAVIGPQPLFEKIRIERRLSAKAVSVWVAKDLLKQVFLNIIINAADAMSGDQGVKQAGSVSVLTLESLNEQEFLIIRFKDTGCGMRPEDLKRIFDPFFTTKAPGKGTGLGLSICYTIMERTGGRIRAKSEFGSGTTVSLELPLANDENEESHHAEKTRANR